MAVAVVKPASKNFEAGLHAYVSSGRATEEETDRIMHVLSMPTRGLLGKRRENILGRMERRARAEMGAGEREAIDWDNIPWEKIFEFIMKILAMFGI